jgi:hypothetical protein
MGNFGMMKLPSCVWMVQWWPLRAFASLLSTPDWLFMGDGNLLSALELLRIGKSISMLSRNTRIHLFLLEENRSPGRVFGATCNNQSHQDSDRQVYIMSHFMVSTTKVRDILNADNMLPPHHRPHILLPCFNHPYTTIIFPTTNP